jgi:hypothetical protein
MVTISWTCRSIETGNVHRILMGNLLESSSFEDQEEDGRLKNK